tara:strand:+ start:223 stop:465 length:243 start_codon:yes stop_codon:yes gene_type:complete
MNICADISKITLGRVPIGGLFTYDSKLWVVVNRIDGASKKLVINVGAGNRQSILLASCIEVCYINEVRNIQEGSYESDRF